MDLYKITHQEILEKISLHCPDALWAYLQCINRSDSLGNIFFSKKTVENDMSHRWTKFRNSIKKLALENILEWHPYNGGIAVTLAEFDDN